LLNPGSALLADFSRRRPKKMSHGRPKRPAPGGLTPKTPVGTSTQKRDQTNNEEKEGSIETIGETNDISSASKLSAIAVRNQVVKNGSIARVDKDAAELQKMETDSKTDIENIPDRMAPEGRHLDAIKTDDTTEDKSKETDEKMIDEVSLKLKLEMEANLRKEKIEMLAEENW